MLEHALALSNKALLFQVTYDTLRVHSMLFFYPNTSDLAVYQSVICKTGVKFAQFKTDLIDLY